MTVLTVEVRRILGLENGLMGQEEVSETLR